MNSLAQSSLTAVERAELKKYESILSTNMDTFLKAGTALKAIRDGRLYRESYGTFEKYLRERWSLPRTLAYYYLDAAEVIDRLLCQNFDIHPRASEINRAGQLKELKNVADDDLPAVVNRAVQIAGMSTLTAKVLKQAAQEITVNQAENISSSDECDTRADSTGSSNSTGIPTSELDCSSPNSIVNDKVLVRAREKLREAIKCIRLHLGNLGLGGQAEAELQSISRMAQL